MVVDLDWRACLEFSLHQSKRGNLADRNVHFGHLCNTLSSLAGYKVLSITIPLRMSDITLITLILVLGRTRKAESRAKVMIFAQFWGKIIHTN